MFRCSLVDGWRKTDPITVEVNQRKRKLRRLLVEMQKKTDVYYTWRTILFRDLLVSIQKATDPISAEVS
ncbi:hypothetical protein V1477_014711 [Vespula maculifrons]|uniref:Uncharacterized protein n=1 Tax=Vespula maculifrons TaxID=7453 RepID=A0ABD2BI77_VESMC